MIDGKRTELTAYGGIVRLPPGKPVVDGPGAAPGNRRAALVTEPAEVFVGDRSSEASILSGLRRRGEEA